MQFFRCGRKLYVTIYVHNIAAIGWNGSSRSRQWNSWFVTVSGGRRCSITRGKTSMISESFVYSKVVLVEKKIDNKRYGVEKRTTESICMHKIFHRLIWHGYFVFELSDLWMPNDFWKHFTSEQSCTSKSQSWQIKESFIRKVHLLLECFVFFFQVCFWSEVKNKYNNYARNGIRNFWFQTFNH